MTSNLGGWIHSFTVTDAQTHKDGYTVYKITSVVFPRSVPQALTCLTVWKRFHDIKRLHRELFRRHKSLQLTGKLPEPTDISFFNRFSENVINKRKEYILQLLEFTAQHPALFKCHAFTQFFSEASQVGVQSSFESPLHRLHVEQDKKNSGAIVEICDKLDLPFDQHNEIRILDPSRDNENIDNNESEVRDKVSENIVGSKAVETAIVTPIEIETQQISLENLVIGKSSKDSASLLNSMASTEIDNSDYIYEAALQFSYAVQAEANLDFKEAHLRYKSGVETLLNGSKGDTNEERKYVANAKISKYLARAEDIYDKHLKGSSDKNSPINTTFQLSIDLTDSRKLNNPGLYLQRPWNHLSKYKVVDVLGGKVMLVEAIAEPLRPVYAMKGIEMPPTNSPAQSIYLPQHVAYMVQLVAFFQSEDKIFVLLEQAKGGRLLDYLATYSPSTESPTSVSISDLFPDSQDKSTPIKNNNKSNIESCEQESTNPENVEISPTTSVKIADSKIAEIEDADDINSIMRSSQELLQSVSITLKETEQTRTTIESAIHEAKNTDELSDNAKSSTSKEHSKPKQDNMKSNEFSKDNGRNNLSKDLPISKIPEASIIQWARELAVAIHSLHDKGVVLKDFHMNNVLLGMKGHIALTYFHKFEALVPDNDMHFNYNPEALEGHFVAPERPLTCKSDWWSYGVFLYHLLVGMPFRTTHPGYVEIYRLVQYPQNVEISDNARDLLNSLLDQDPDDRLDYKQIQEHKFFEGTNWKEVLTIGLNTDLRV